MSSVADYHLTIARSYTNSRSCAIEFARVARALADSATANYFIHCARAWNHKAIAATRKAKGDKQS